MKNPKRVGKGASSTVGKTVRGEKSEGSGTANACFVEKMDGMKRMLATNDSFLKTKGEQWKTHKAL